MPEMPLITAASTMAQPIFQPAKDLVGNNPGSENDFAKFLEKAAQDILEKPQERKTAAENQSKVETGEKGWSKSESDEKPTETVTAYQDSSSTAAVEEESNIPGELEVLLTMAANQVVQSMPVVAEDLAVNNEIQTELAVESITELGGAAVGALKSDAEPVKMKVTGDGKAELADSLTEATDSPVAQSVAAVDELATVFPKTEASKGAAVSQETADFMEQVTKAITREADNLAKTDAAVNAFEELKPARPVVEDKVSATGELPQGTAEKTVVASAEFSGQQQESGDQPRETKTALVMPETETKKGKINLALLQTQFAVKEVADPGPSIQGGSDLSLAPVIPQNNLVNLPTDAVSEVTNAETPVNREEVFSQIVEHAKVLVGKTGSEMEISLKPDYLGKVQLKVVVENQVVTAKFVAESQQVKEIIESNLNELRRNLQETGMQIDSLMVSVGAQSNNEQFQQNNLAQSGFGESKRSAGLNENEAMPTPESAESPSGYRSDSLIDLIA